MCVCVCVCVCVCMKVSERERQSKRMGEEGGKTQKTERVEGAFELLDDCACEKLLRGMV